MTIHYILQAINPHAHVFSVSCTIEKPNPEGQQFYLPAWIPGSYKIRDFAKYVSNLQAKAKGKPIPCYKIDKSTWQCEPTTSAITLYYEVYAWDLSVRGAHLDQTHGFANGASVFLCPVGAESLPCLVEIKAPVGEEYKKWRVATALKPQQKTAYAFGEYQAENYAELIDSPIEMGNFVVETFTEKNITHELVFSGLAPNTDTKRIAQDVKKICAYYLTLFPKPYPMKRYVFLITLLEQGFGGLEHRESCSLHFTKYYLPTRQDVEVSENYSTFLSLCSHEYFHAWLVKTLKPQAFMPYDLHQENYTTLLWLFEGFTFYYEDLALVRSGLINQKQYFTNLSQRITRLWRTPGRLVQSVAESSFDAWIKFYQPNEDTPNITISYYLKGGLIALLLDLRLRELSNDQYSVDNVMLTLWERYSTDPHGVPEDAITNIIQEKLGKEIAAWFLELVDTATELPLEKTLALVGVNLYERAAAAATEKGEVLNTPFEKPKKITVDLGVTLDARNMVLNCFTNSSAQRAGISANDVIVAIDNLRVDNANIALHLSRYAPGDTISVHAFRLDQLMSFTLTLQPAAPLAVLVVPDDVTPLQKNRRQKWLSS